MKLSYRILGAGEPIIILHGVFGSSDNWQTVGKMLSEHFKVYLVDQRNHGNSPHSEEFSYSLMAADIKELMESENLTDANLLGHSMGGKVAMEFATTFPEKAKKLVVVDIAPKYYKPHHQQVLAAFRAVDLNQITSRGDAEASMAPIISEFGIRQFLLKNLKRSNEGFSWKVNLDVIEGSIENIGNGLANGRSYTGRSLFIAGGKSDYVKKTDHSLIASHFPDSQVIYIAGAGHWVHAEKPKELYESVYHFLSQS